MKVEIDFVIIKDILLEQWNEGLLSSSEVLMEYESITGVHLDAKSKELFLKLLDNWNSFGIQKFVEIEKFTFDGKGDIHLSGEQYVEQFIQHHFQHA